MTTVSTNTLSFSDDHWDAFPLDAHNLSKTMVAKMHDAKLSYVDHETGQAKNLFFKQGESFIMSSAPEGKFLITFFEDALMDAVKVIEVAGSLA